MPIVNSVAGQPLDDVYVLLTNPPAAISGVNSSAVGVVGSVSRGIPGALYSVSNYGDFVTKLGPSAAGLTGPIEVQNLVKQGCGDITFVPVFGSGAAAATVTLDDSSTTPAPVLELTFADVHPQLGTLKPSFGTCGNGATAKVTAGSTSGTFNLTITSPSGTQETYSGLTDSNMVPTINASSKIVIASLPSGVTSPSTVPAAGTFNFSGGSNGAATVDADYIGTTDASGNKTGLTALATGPQYAFIMACGQSSSAINSQLATMANQLNCIAILNQPQGTQPSAAITAVASTVQDNVIWAYPWQNVYDADTQSYRWTSPASFVVGVGSVQGPEQSLGNKTINGSLGTDVQLGQTDIGNLVSANIMVVGVTIPAGGTGIRNGQVSSGKLIYVTRMRYFIALGVNKSMGWAVDQLQSTDKNDPLRRQVQNTVGSWLETLMGNRATGAGRMIDAYQVVCDLSNNSPDTIANHQLNCDITVNLLSAAEKVVMRANIAEGILSLIHQ